jgi:hypothetical protein
MDAKIFTSFVESRISSILGKDCRYVIANWHGTPIFHDILRNELFVYNEKLEGDFELGGLNHKFIKVETLPDEREAKLLEWKVIDLMNNFKYSHTSKWEELQDLVKALKSKRNSTFGFYWIFQRDLAMKTASR